MTRRRVLWVCLLVFTLLVSLAGCYRESDPVAVLTSAVVSGPAPLDVGFNLSYSEHPQGSSIEFRLDFGDSSTPVSGQDLGLAVHHTYESGGTYVADLTLADDRGGRSIDRLTITVSDDGPPIGVGEGMTAPDFTAHTTDGGETTLSDFLGSVILLDFWGVWCGPCRRSMPHLDGLAKTFGPQGLVAIVVSTDHVEQTSIAYLADNGFDDFVSVWEPGGKSGNRVAQLYGVSSSSVGIPRTFLIDRQGVIRFVGHPIADLTIMMIEALL